MEPEFRHFKNIFFRPLSYPNNKIVFKDGGSYGLCDECYDFIKKLDTLLEKPAYSDTDVYAFITCNGDLGVFINIHHPKFFILDKNYYISLITTNYGNFTPYLKPIILGKKQMLQSQLVFNGYK